MFGFSNFQYFGIIDSVIISVMSEFCLLHMFLKMLVSLASPPCLKSSNAPYKLLVAIIYQ